MTVAVVFTGRSPGRGLRNAGIVSLILGLIISLLAWVVAALDQSSLGIGNSSNPSVNQAMENVFGSLFSTIFESISGAILSYSLPVTALGIAAVAGYYIHKKQHHDAHHEGAHKKTDKVATDMKPEHHDKV